MSKELEALGKNIRYKKEHIGNDTYRLYIKKNDIELLEQALQRLESINNANPSEALECLMYLKAEFRDYPSAFNCIKQSLLNAQEQKKVLKIIKKKNVNTGLINVLGSVEQYNQTYVYDNMLNTRWCLTEEEFALFKEWLESDLKSSDDEEKEK